MQAQRFSSRLDVRFWNPLPAPSFSLRITPEVLVLAFICTLDMLTTAYWLHHGMATEANPLLSGHAAHGLLPFVLAKLSSFVPALIAAEWYGRKRPEFVRPLLRLAATGYLGIYIVLVGRQFWG